MTDIIDLVLQDHHVVAGLFDELQAANGADEQAKLFAQVKDSLELNFSPISATRCERTRVARTCL